MATGTDARIQTRRPAAAGRFYPAAQARLRAEVSRYLAAPPRNELGPLRALIVPHAGYVCSGLIAAHAFAAMASLSQIEPTVFLIGPAHWVATPGIALSAMECFATPLGSVPVNTVAVAELLDRDAPFHLHEKAHRPEHALEVELPFMQVAHPRFTIVPLLLQEECWAEELCVALDQLLDSHAPALIIVSSDLSHGHAYRKACARDGALLHAIGAGDVDSARQGEACGLPAILALMMLAQRRNWTDKLLAYANSGDTCSDRRAVVGYGAVAFTA